MSLGVYWDGEEVGRLERLGERTREYSFRYSEDAKRPISLSLPLDQQRFSSAESRPFFEALLPEGAVREQIASQLKLAASDSFGLLSELGRDCAGALQIIDAKRMSEPPSVRWLDANELSALVEELPRHPLGIHRADEHLRLSLAGVQHKAVLVRDGGGNFGKPLDGMASSHILKPEPPNSQYPGLATNEYFCMRLAALSGLSCATVELLTVAHRPCVVVERFDRELVTSPHRRVHQEDLCQALGLTPDFKYQRSGWRLPSYGALAEVLNQHSTRPGLDRLAGAQAAIFNFLVGNADAHAKNISLLHTRGGVRLAPLYDIVSAAAYPEISTELALSIGDELDPNTITSIHWSDLAVDFGLNVEAFRRIRSRLTDTIATDASRLSNEAHAQGWHHPCIDSILDTIADRSPRVS
ncbi:MAG TPA: type II toxin-antitoxin system HipA family toxin [Solirubrobacteraceae bacterium]|jgi:serine/threonine-protein kinase HipA|nr:type II toxin-antitoxin system HipA family toxin [Solirubrobacteraceae bacterium]